MNRSKWKLLLSSPLGCRITAIAGLGICAIGLIININHNSGGNIESFSELCSCFGEDEIAISIMGISLFFVFMYAAKNAEKMQKEQRENSERENELENLYENAFSQYGERQKMKPSPYTMGSGQYEISFLVPPAYSWDKAAKINEELGYVSSPVMMHETGGIVHCNYNVATEDELLEGDYSGPEELVREAFELLAKKTQENTKIHQLVIDGKYLVHYYIARYKMGRDKFQTIYAACEPEPGKVFEFELTYASWEYKVTEKDMEPFFRFQ